MSRQDHPGRENEELRDRLARLSAAILRISASLELNEVLREVVDSAGALTAARCGVIATVGDLADGIRFFILSHGEQSAVRELPGTLAIRYNPTLPAPTVFGSFAATSTKADRLSGPEPPGPWPSVNPPESGPWK